MQVTHPEVTFNSWTKKCVVMLYGTASQPEEITNTVKATELHSWPVVRASRQAQRERERDPRHVITLIRITYDHKPCKSERNEQETTGRRTTVEPVSPHIYPSVPLCMFSSFFVLRRRHTRKSGPTLKHTLESQKARKSTFIKSIIIYFIDCHPFPTVDISLNTSIYWVNHNSSNKNVRPELVVTFLIRSEEDR